MRVGLFTSSEIYRLMTNGRASGTLGQAALTYIKDKQYEIQIGRSLSVQTFAHSSSWGVCLERYIYYKLSMDWELVSEDRLKHPTLPWSGAPDIRKANNIGDIKCPYTLRSFLDQLTCFGNIDRYKGEFPEYYWQLVSNCILAGAEYATCVLAMPKLGELEEIREDIATDESADWHWISKVDIDRLPYLPDDCKLDSVHEWTWKVPGHDMEALHERVEVASKMLINNL